MLLKMLNQRCWLRLGTMLTIEEDAFFCNISDSGQEVMGPAYRTAAGMMLCMFFAVTSHNNIGFTL